MQCHQSCLNQSTISIRSSTYSTHNTIKQHLFTYLRRLRRTVHCQAMILTHSLTHWCHGWMDGWAVWHWQQSFVSLPCRVVLSLLCCGMGNSQFTNASIIYLLTPSIHPSIWRNGAAESSWVATFPISPHDNPIGHHNKQQHTEHWTLLPRARSDGRVRARPPTRRVLPSAVQRGVGWWMDGWMDALLYAHTHTQSDSLSSNISISLLPHSSSSFQTFELIELCRCGSLLRWTAQKEGRAQLISAAAAAAATRSTEHKSRRLNLLLALFSSLHFRNQVVRKKENKKKMKRINEKWQQQQQHQEQFPAVISRLLPDKFISLLLPLLLVLLRLSTWS